MALVLSPWFGRSGCAGRRARSNFRFTACPSSLQFTDLVVIKVPQMAQRQAASCSPAAQGSCCGSAAMADVRFVQWSETPESNVFKLRLSGLKKEDLHIQVEDDRTLYISYSNQSKEDSANGEAKDRGVKDAAEDVKEALKEGEAAAPAGTSSEQQIKARGGCSCMRKFKLPENADLEQIKAEVTNETLTVTVPKRKMSKAPETRNVEVSEGGAPGATNPQASSSSTTAPSHVEGKEAGKSSEQPSSSSEPSPSSGTSAA